MLRYADAMSDENETGAPPHFDVPEHLRYSEDHVWIDETADPAVVGVTDYAATQLGDLVYVDLPEVGTHIEAGDEVVELESSKAVEPLIAPVSGTIAYVNTAAADDPSVVNTDPYGEGWLLKVNLDDDEPDLLDSEQYVSLIH